MGLKDTPSGPATIAPLVWTIGHLTMCLIVDSTALPDPEHTQAMLSAFYHAKTVSPPMWFLGINLALLLLGLLGNFGSLINFFFAKCSLKRRALELLGVALFVCNVALNIVHVMPLEKSVASLSRTVTSELDAIRTQLFQAHLVAALVSFLMIGHMCAVWAAPNAQAEADAVEDALQRKLRAAHAAAAAGKKKQ